MWIPWSRLFGMAPTLLLILFAVASSAPCGVYGIRPAARKPVLRASLVSNSSDGGKNQTGNSTMEYPCGRESKWKGFKDYRDNLLSSVCSVPTAQGFGCASSLECLVNDFYTKDCGGLGAPAKTCQVCTSAAAMANSSIGGESYDGTFFYPYKSYFQREYGEYQYLRTVISDEVLGKELACAAMIMVKDNCAKGTTQPSCFANIEYR